MSPVLAGPRDVGQGHVGGTPKEEEKMEARGGRGGRGRGQGKYTARHESDKFLCCCWFSGLGGAVNSTEAATRKAAFPTLGLASGTSRCSRSCHVSALLGFWLFKCHSSSDFRMDLFTFKSSTLYFKALPIHLEEGRAPGRQNRLPACYFDTQVNC